MSKPSPFPLYEKFLRLYPKPYRDKYGEQMMLTLSDMLAAADTPAAKRWVWLRTAVDLPLSIIREQYNYTGDIMTREMPNYIKLSGGIGTVLVAPFFLFVILDALTGHKLYRSWPWHTHILFTWIILFPAAALAINAVSYMVGVYERRRRSSKPLWQVLIDIHRSWPALGVMVIGLGILALVFGHDSVHCVVHNPVPLLQHWHTTWECIKTG